MMSKNKFMCWYHHLIFMKALMEFLGKLLCIINGFVINKVMLDGSYVLRIAFEYEKT